MLLTRAKLVFIVHHIKRREVAQQLFNKQHHKPNSNSGKLGRVGTLPTDVKMDSYNMKLATQ